MLTIQFVIVFVILTLALCLVGCSKDEIQDDVDKVKKEAEVLKEDVQGFLSAKKELLGDLEAKLVEDFSTAEKIVVVDVKDAEGYANHLKNNVITKVDELKAKAEEFKTEHPLMEEAKTEYTVILDEVKSTAQKVIDAANSGEQAAFDTAKKDFEAAKEKLVSFEEAVKSKISK